MTSTRAIAIDVRDNDGGALLGVALVVPSNQYLSILTCGSDQATERELAPEMWREIDAWVTASDAALPSRPAPMNTRVVSAMLAEDARSVSAHRFASLALPFDGELGWLAERLLPEFFKTRRSA